MRAYLCLHKQSQLFDKKKDNSIELSATRLQHLFESRIPDNVVSAHTHQLHLKLAKLFSLEMWDMMVNFGDFYPSFCDKFMNEAFFKKMVNDITFITYMFTIPSEWVDNVLSYSSSSLMRAELEKVIHIHTQRQYLNFAVCHLIFFILF